MNFSAGDFVIHETLGPCILSKKAPGPGAWWLIVSATGQRLPASESYFKSVTYSEHLQALNAMEKKHAK